MITIRHERERVELLHGPSAPRTTSEFIIHDDVSLPSLLPELTRILHGMGFEFDGELEIVEPFSDEPSIDEIRDVLDEPQVTHCDPPKRKRKR